MADGSDQVEVSEAQIASHWKEEDLIHPSEQFVAQANMADADVFERFSENNFPDYFHEYANLLSWAQEWHTTLTPLTRPSGTGSLAAS